MLADAFEALKKYDWGTDMAVLSPIEDAVSASHGNTQSTRDLESRLIVVLQGNPSRDARDYICRKLAIVGSAASVPFLAELLTNKDDSHMARFALERMSAPEAARALRDALAKVSGKLKIGVISSLGSRRDEEAVKPLGALLGDTDLAVARAAALAVGMIGSAESTSVLQAALQAGIGNKHALLDALLACAEGLLAGGKKSDAKSIYNSLLGNQQGRLIRLAATRGLLASAAHEG